MQFGWKCLFYVEEMFVYPVIILFCFTRQTSMSAPQARPSVTGMQRASTPQVLSTVCVSQVTQEMAHAAMVSYVNSEKLTTPSPLIFLVILVSGSTMSDIVTLLQPISQICHSIQLKIM